jgi:hypothetical protein
VFFRNTSNGGNVAETYSWWDATGKLVDADIVMYEGAYQFFTTSGCTAAIYAENVAVHEFGHVLGLGHSSVSGATMASSMPKYCDRSQLTLESDHISGVESLYPAGAAPTNSAPAVTTASPSTGASYSTTSSIAFAGAASDAQDGNLTSRLVWRSSVSGQIGTGGAFTTTLAAGLHAITATVSDSGGLPGPAVVNLTITAPASGATLSAREYKSRAQQRVDLTWAGLTGPSVDVLRNGTRITVVGNSGAMTDTIGKGSGTYRYRVCVTNTSTCTNEASVTF